MKAFRSDKNPIIKKEDILPSSPNLKILGVFNCGAARFNDEVILLLRVAEAPKNNNLSKISVLFFNESSQELKIKEFSKNDNSINTDDPRIIKTSEGAFLTSISHLRLARSKNGQDFEIEKYPAIFPENEYERYGIEDPRITQIDDIYYITYVAVSDKTGITTCLASTIDFINYRRHGVIFLPDNKDAVIFPEKINGFYYALNRPESDVFNLKNIWISRSLDLESWGEHEKLMGTREKYWDSNRIGAGAVPFKTDKGWLEIYHGVSNNNVYSLGAVLLDIKNPAKIIARSKEPILKPEAYYETSGFVENVVFTCGLLYEEDEVKIYYGASDCSVSYAQISLKDIMSEIF